MFSWEYFSSFFFNDPATTEIYTLSLHDALPIFHLDVFRGILQQHRPALAVGNEEAPRRRVGNAQLLRHQATFQEQAILAARFLRKIRGDGGEARCQREIGRANNRTPVTGKAPKA